MSPIDSVFHLRELLLVLFDRLREDRDLGLTLPELVNDTSIRRLVKLELISQSLYVQLELVRVASISLASLCQWGSVSTLS